MSDSEHSTVTYTSVSEDDSDIGSPGVDGPPIMPEVPPSPDYIPGPEGPPSPDYVPGPEEPEQAPPSPIYIPFVPEPVYPEFLPVDDEVFPAEEQPMPAADSPTHQSPGYIPESDPEEDLEEDDEEDPEEDPADYPADRGDRDDPYLSYCVTGYRMSIRPQRHKKPFISKEVAEKIRDALPSLVHEIEMPEMCLPLHKRPRQVGNLPQAEADLYGFADMLDAAQDADSKEFRLWYYGLYDDLTPSEGISLRDNCHGLSSPEINELADADHREEASRLRCRASETAGPAKILQSRATSRRDNKQFLDWVYEL
ncbi:hypothetical protein Tco_1502972 [Tanacetum coccineum]